MIKINILTVGSIKEKFFLDAINEYKKRLTRFCKLEIIEVCEQTNMSGEKKIESECKLLKSHVKGYSILLDRVGELVSSEDLAKTIQNVQGLSSEITFIVGGSNGVSESLKKQVDKVVSFGKITFPHQLFRVVLLEQVYRAFTINSALPYHK